MKNSNKQRKGLLAATIALFAGSAQIATAQDNDAATSQGILDEIIVTATKRAETLNDISASIAAIGSAEIERKNLSGMDDYLRFVPGVSMLDRGAGQNTVVIRGISADPQGETDDGGTSVGVYLGEAPISGFGVLGGTSDLQLVDMERIEVLRGPQGTLFGSGSLSGTVRNIPNAPDLSQLSGNFKTTFSSTTDSGGDNNKVQGMINIPLIEDELAIRAVAYRFDNSGYVDNIAASHPTFSDVPTLFGAGPLAVDRQGVGDVEYVGGRIAALWQASDTLDVTLTYVTQDTEQDGQIGIDLSNAAFEQTVLQFGNAVPGASAEEQKDEFDMTNLVINYDLGWGSLVSSSQWLEQTGTFNADITSILGGLPMAQSVIHDVEVFTQELRIASELDGPFQYLVGIYYEDIDTQADSPIYWLGDLAAFEPIGFGPLPFGASNSQIDDFAQTRSIQQEALFTELSYDLNDLWTLTLGARWYQYERQNNLTGVGALSGDYSNSYKIDESGSNFKLNLAYQPDDDTMVYAQFSEGFRLGGTQAPVPESICDADHDDILDGTSLPITEGYDSDEVDNFEIGAKLTMLDNRLQINAAAYHIDWEGIPISVPATGPVCFFAVTLNAAEAQSQGIEFETTYKVSEQLQLNVSGSIVNAELTVDTPNLGSDGDRLPGSPEQNFNVGLQYDFDMAGNNAYFRGDYAYVSDFYAAVGEAGIEAGDYGQLNISLGADFNNNLSLELFATNLTNEDANTWVDVLFTADTRGFRMRPRTMGINLGYHF